MAQKGISLPINMVVILALAILVLVVAAAFFVIGTNPTNLNDQDAWSTGCAISSSRGCNLADFQPVTGLQISRYDPDGDDAKNDFGQSVCIGAIEPIPDSCTDNTLFNACRRTQALSRAEECRVRCCGS